MGVPNHSVNKIKLIMKFKFSNVGLWQMGKICKLSYHKKYS